VSEAVPRDVRRLAERVLRLEAEAILGVIPKVDERFERAIQMMRDCTGRIVVTGIGKSGLVGTEDRRHARVHGDAGLLPPSRRGQCTATWGCWLAATSWWRCPIRARPTRCWAILPPLKRLGVPIVLLTGNPKSTLARQSDVVLDVSVAEEACPMNLAPTSSTTAALAMGDALAMVLLEMRGLRP
jgi:arabinose-5-phosphate isomerase